MTSLTRDSLSAGTRALGAAGLLPFIGGALAVAIAPPSWHGAALQALTTYAALIVSFLGGIHWGAPTGSAHDGARAWGVVPSLIAWPMLLVPSPQLALPGLAGALVLCWAVDRTRFASMGLAALLPLRARLTAVAVLCCLVGAAFA